MNGDQLFGILRAILIYVGTTLATKGYVTDTAWQVYSGAILSIVTAVYAVVVAHNLTADSFGSALRSIFAAVAGYLQGRNLITADQSTQLAAIVALAIPAAWSWIAHRLPGQSVNVPPGAAVVLLACLALPIGGGFLTGCTTDPTTGKTTIDWTLVEADAAKAKAVALASAQKACADFPIADRLFLRIAASNPKIDAQARADEKAAVASLAAVCSAGAGVTADTVDAVAAAYAAILGAVSAAQAAS